MQMVVVVAATAAATTVMTNGNKHLEECSQNRILLAGGIGALRRLPPVAYGSKLHHIFAPTNALETDVMYLQPLWMLLT
jgi:hypothetical protein